MREAQQQGFTLIELSIVLVIIGLIVGGVLVGQDLIRAAGVRATISQVEKYNTAVNTFREKYGALPGDMMATAAAKFGFASRPSGIAGQSDGNGVLQACNYTPNFGFFLGCETAMFWVDLSAARLIDNNFTAGTAWNNGFVTGSISAFVPEAKLGNGNYIPALSQSATNYFGIAALTEANSGFYDSGTANVVTGNLTTQQAFNLDKKTDDGFPLTGRVEVMDLSLGYNLNLYSGSMTPPSVGTPAAQCISNPGGPFTNVYALQSSVPACQLAIQFQ